MNIYCGACNKIQMASIDNCHDAVTGEPFQDIVCGYCNFVIASGTDIKHEWVGLTEEEMQSVHDTYHKRMGPQEFARAIEAKLKEKNT